MGLEALGPFVRGTHLNVAQIMLRVGRDARTDRGTPLMGSAKTRRFLFLLLSLLWLTYKDALTLRFIFPCAAGS